MICADVDPFDLAACEFNAAWLVTARGAGPLDDCDQRPICEHHKRVHEKYYAKYYPNARVTFTRIGETAVNATTDVKPPKLFRIPAGTKSTTCSKCSARIYFVDKQPLRAEPTCWHATKRVMVPTPDAVPPSLEKDGAGFSHFIDCPNANDFRRKK